MVHFAPIEFQQRPPPEAQQGVDPVAYLHETAKRALLFGEKSVLLPHQFKAEQAATPD